MLSLQQHSIYSAAIFDELIPAWVSTPIKRVADNAIIYVLESRNSRNSRNYSSPKFIS